MKKLTGIITILLICGSLILSGCASPSPSYTTHTTDENGNTVIESNGYRTVMINDVPYDLQYNDSCISLVDVACYESVTNYSHALFIVTTLDVSNLSEEQLHWLRESDLDVRAYITSESNNYDFDSASLLGSLLLTDTKQLFFVHTSSFFKENRYSFSSSELSITVTATQEETYKHTTDSGNTMELNVEEVLQFSTTLGESLPDAEEIQKPLYNYVANWLHEKAEFFS